MAVFFFFESLASPASRLNLSGTNRSANPAMKAQINSFAMSDGLSGSCLKNSTKESGGVFGVAGRKAGNRSPFNSPEVKRRYISHAAITPLATDNTQFIHNPNSKAWTSSIWEVSVDQAKAYSRVRTLNPAPMNPKRNNGCQSGTGPAPQCQTPNTPPYDQNKEKDCPNQGEPALE